MWPGQQPPGGEQNPQDKNPYQQPGYPNTQPPGQQPAGGPPVTPPPAMPPTQPPGGYQQPAPAPGYGYPAPGSVPTPPPGANPYQEQTGANAYQNQYGTPAPPGPPAPGGPGGPQNERKKTIITSVVAGVVVIAALVGTGVFVFKDDKDGGTPQAGGDKNSQVPATKQPTAPPASDPAAPAPGGSASNPRAGIDTKPTVPGWKVVVNTKHGSMFDVPQEWVVSTADNLIGFEDKAGKTVSIMSAPAVLNEKWCSEDADKDGEVDSTALAQTGTTGSITGSKTTADVAEGQAGNWAYGGYGLEDKEKVKVGKAKPYTTASGLTGSLSTATVVGVKKTSRCVTDGKAYAFGFKNAQGDFKTWILHSAKGVKEEVPEALVTKILNTVRLAG